MLGYARAFLGSFFPIFSMVFRATGRLGDLPHLPHLPPVSILVVSSPKAFGITQMTYNRGGTCF